MSEALPSFSGDTPTCAKCGYEGATTQYRELGQCVHSDGNTVLGIRKNERLHRECFRCGYAWDEALATDEEGSVEAAITRVRALHREEYGSCEHCTRADSVPYPCPTIRALNGGKP